MQFKVTYQGKREIGQEWAHFAWLVEINGETFEYRTGLGHATSRHNKLGMAYHKKPVTLQGKEVIALPNEWVHVPSADDVLHCLFSDADAGAYSFDDFCDNLGYSNDSLKALDTYRACMESSKKLRKALGKEYGAESARIAALEL
jgi:hypothetical protein